MPTTVVYVDILISLNLIINYLLLLSSARIAGRKIMRVRVMAAALFGALCTLIIFVPLGSGLLIFAYKLLTALVIVFLAYKWIGALQFLKDVFVFFTISYLLAGILLAVWANFAPSGMLYYNGVVYFDLSATVLVGTTAVAYLLISVFARIFNIKTTENELVKATIIHNDAQVELSAIIDNGNKLAEPFSGLPVAVCCIEDITPILDRGMLEQILRLTAAESVAAENFPEGFRLIPFSSVGRSGFLVAFKPTCIKIVAGSENYLAEDVYLGVSSQKIGDSSFSLILSNEMLKIKIKT